MQIVTKVWKRIIYCCMFFLFFFQDKTFGLKNKKGAKQQKFIKNVTQQVKYGQQSARQVGCSSLVICSYLSFDLGFLHQHC